MVEKVAESVEKMSREQLLKAAYSAKLSEEDSEVEFAKDDDSGELEIVI